MKEILKITGHKLKILISQLLVGAVREGRWMSKTVMTRRVQKGKSIKPSLDIINRHLNLMTLHGRIINRFPLPVLTFYDNLN